MKKKSVLLRTSRGQALIEFAGTLVLLILLLMGIISGTLALYTQFAVGAAADAGSRAAAMYGGNAPAVYSAIESSLRSLWVMGPFTYSVTPPAAGYHQDISVQVSYQAPVRIVFWDLYLKPQTATRPSEIDSQWGP